MTPATSALILFGVFLGLAFLRVPIGVALAFSCMATCIFSGKVPLEFVAQSMVTAADSFPLMAIPLFILAGEIMGQGGIAKRLLNCGNVFFGRVCGGTAIVTVVCCMFFAAISGSGPATVAAIGGITIPVMIEMGYDRKFACGITAAAGALGCIIPPSIPMVTYSVFANSSVGALFMAGFVPGILMGSLLCLYSYFHCKKRGYSNASVEKYTFQQALRVFWDAKWSLMVPVIILGGIYGGIFTPTEAAGVAVAYGVIVGCFVYREINVKQLYEVFANAAVTCGTIMLIMCCAGSFSRILALEKIPALVSNALLGLTSSKVGVLIMVNVIMMIAGCFIDPNSGIIILGGIFLPLLKSLDVSIIHIGIIMVMNLSLGMVTPPIGADLFVACNISGAGLGEVSKGAIKPLLIMFAIVFLATFVPEITIGLPKLLGMKF